MEWIIETGDTTMPINAHLLQSKSGLWAIHLENAIAADRPGTVDVFVPGYMSAARAKVAGEQFALAIGRVARWD